MRHLQTSLTLQLKMRLANHVYGSINNDKKHPDAIYEFLSIPFLIPESRSYGEHQIKLPHKKRVKNTVKKISGRGSWSWVLTDGYPSSLYLVDYGVNHTLQRNMR